jgi:hypothetical protein
MKDIQDYLRLNKKDKKTEVLNGAVEMFSILHPQLKISFIEDSFRIENGTELQRQKCIKEIESFFEMCRF